MANNVKIFPICYRYSLKGFNKVTFDRAIPLSHRYNLRGFDKVILPNKEKTLKRKK